MDEAYNEFAEPGVSKDLGDEFSQRVSEIFTQPGNAEDELAVEAEAEASAQKKRTIEIADEVIEIVAGIAASKTPGVAAMVGSGTGFMEILGRKNYGHGVRIDVKDGKADIDVHVIASQGKNLGQLFLELQSNIKEAVENMTGLAVSTVNVYTEGISGGDDPSAKEAKSGKEAAFEKEDEVDDMKE